MAGFDNVPSASERRSYNSWGRTRTPKNILSPHRAGINAAGAPLTLQMGATTTVTCITENQRFLHVVVQAPTNGARLAIVGQMYAAATYDADGNPNAYSDIPLSSTAGTPLAALDAPGHHLVEIGGIDKIKFTLTDANAGGDATIQVYAACSTFSTS